MDRRQESIILGLSSGIDFSLESSFVKTSLADGEGRTWGVKMIANGEKIDSHLWLKLALLLLKDFVKDYRSFEKEHGLYAMIHIR
ncbi:hypothetical protein CEXT_424081 [Caerostris extrusa]|uniref:Uncharacterized protein n=1 Tax=Caerostris extrusa TaxID=172846 RepID=A0AAV4M8K7_CAEEX|nr:hypothetical protein CEXT_424081 [Caerostris extrusa]